MTTVPASTPSTSTSDPTLNFFSPQFDALKALRTPGVTAPLASAPPRNNLYACRSLLPESHPEYMVATAARVPVKKQATSTSSDTDVDSLTSALARFNTSFTTPPPIYDPHTQQLASQNPSYAGPLQLLITLYNQRARIRVVIRRARGIRGTIDGYVKAWDRHMNLVILDGEERYTREEWRPVTSATSNHGVQGRRHSTSMDDATSSPPPSSLEITSDPSHPHGRRLMERVLIHRTRHLNQVFVRGDNIVMISAAPSSSTSTSTSTTSTSKSSSGST